MRLKNLDIVRRGWQAQVARYGLYIIIGLFLITLPLFVGTSTQGIMTKVLIFGIFATSLNILFGYSGLWSMGHAAFFGLGAYLAALIMLRFGIESFWLVMPLVVLITSLFAATIGFIALRVSGVYFLLVTMAMGQLLYSIAVKWRSVTGGTMGLYGVQYPDLGLPSLNMNTTTFYYLVFIIFIICLLLMYRIVSSPFGYALQGIREDERRMRHLGYNTWLYEYIAYIVAGMMGSVAGTLFLYFNSVVLPDHLGFPLSASVMLMVIIGSDRVVYGPALGAAIIVLLEYYSSIYVPLRWPLILGCVFVLSVMFLRGGVSIYLVSAMKKLERRYGSSKD